MRALVSLLGEAGVRYMIVGSMASTYYGPPRTTQDIDVVVELTASSLSQLLGVVDRDRYYVAEDAAASAVAKGGLFNIIDLRTTWKFDLIIRRDRPFSREEFARRRSVSIDGVRVEMASPEDTVLSKLEWASAGESDRQLRDAASVLEVVGTAIDDAYLDVWAEDLGVAALLERARHLARP